MDYSIKKMIIQYRIEKVYGLERYYPANGNAETICRLLQQATLTAHDLATLRLNPEITVERFKV